SCRRLDTDRIYNVCLLDSHESVEGYRVGLKRSPAQAPLRTVRESFPSHGSSLSKISLRRGDPAISFLCNSIMSCHFILPGCERTGFSNRISAPGEASPLLKQTREVSS